MKILLKKSSNLKLRMKVMLKTKTVGAEVAGDVRELARLRNRAAHTLGFRDWFALSVAMAEMDEDKLIATVDEADRATAEPFARWKAELDDRLAARFACGTGDLRPWHYADPFFQDVPAEGGVDLNGYFAGRDLVELTTRTFDGLGLPACAP